MAENNPYRSPESDKPTLANKRRSRDWFVLMAKCVGGILLAWQVEVMVTGGVFSIRAIILGLALLLGGIGWESRIFLLPWGLGLSAFAGPPSAAALRRQVKREMAERNGLPFEDDQPVDLTGLSADEPAKPSRQSAPQPESNPVSHAEFLKGLDVQSPKEFLKDLEGN